MRLPIILMIIIILLNIGVDYFINRILLNSNKNRCWSRVYSIFSITITLGVVVVISLPRRSGSDATLLFVMWMLFSYFSIYIPRYFYVIFKFLSLLPQLWKKRKWSNVPYIGVAIGIFSFLLMWWGALVNRYNIEINEVSVEVIDLPQSFDGYRIAQISDLHLGTFNNDTTFVTELVDAINKANVDAVMFTGDIVNRKSSELLPFEKILSRIKAKDGVFSILGNHDYGDYADWNSQNEKDANLKLMHDIQQRINWKLLLNKTAYIFRESDSIAVVGVENVGDPPFKIYGSLDEAYDMINDSKTKILLTHNPAHWEKDIKNNQDSNIALTLSGHTHAMQISVCGLSPSIFRYECWSGLYTDKFNQNLYVNVGVGTVAMPMRIGATPEITILTLKKLN